MKVFLLNPDYMLYGDPPLGLAYLAAYIRENLPVDIKILDQISHDNLIKIIRSENPDVIGISAVSSNYYKAKELAAEIKKILPGSILLIGGVHITTSPESFANSPFDIGIIGEGEIPTLSFLKELKTRKKISISELSKIKGLLLRERGRVINTGLPKQIENLDSLPAPARDLLNMKYYSLPRFSSKEEIDPVASIMTSRGCPYACKFCSSSVFWNRRVRFFSAKRVAEEIELLCKKYNYRNIYIYDDLFSINKERLRQIIEGLKEKKILGRVKFIVHGRANCFDEETASLLSEMNVKSIIFGFETGSQRMLNYLKGENIKVEDNINAIKLSRKYHLNPAGFFMIGSPTETVEDLEKTYEFIKSNLPNNFIVYQTIAFPGTAVWEYAVKNRIIDKNFYEKKQKDFIDINTKLLLSKNIKPEEFVHYFNKIRSLDSGKKMSLFKKVMMIRARHIKSMFSLQFLRKLNNLKSEFIKRI